MRIGTFGERVGHGMGTAVMGAAEVATDDHRRIWSDTQAKRWLGVCWSYIRTMVKRDTFYKYMSAGSGRIVLTNRTLRWSTPKTLNDPFDIQFDLNFKVNREAVITAALQKLWEAYSGEDVPVANALGMLMAVFRRTSPGWSREKFEQKLALPLEEGLDKGQARLPELNEQVRELTARSKILCLATAPDNKLMWAHYADSHKGLVMRFRNIAELDSPYSMARPIDYLENMPVLMDDDFLSDMLAGRVGFDASSIMHRLVYTKSLEWAYENEWRIFAGSGRYPDAPYEDRLFDVRELDAVILGFRMDDKDKQDLSGLARELYPHAEIFQTQKKADAFKFDVVPLDRS